MYIYIYIQWLKVRSGLWVCRLGSKLLPLRLRTMPLNMRRALWQVVFLGAGVSAGGSFACFSTKGGFFSCN